MYAQMSHVVELNAMTLTFTPSALRMRCTLTPNAPLADAEACDPSLMKISNSAFWSGLPFHPLPEYTWMSTDDESPLLVR